MKVNKLYESHKNDNINRITNYQNAVVTVQPKVVIYDGEESLGVGNSIEVY